MQLGERQLWSLVNHDQPSPQDFATSGCSAYIGSDVAMMEAGMVGSRLSSSTAPNIDGGIAVVVSTERGGEAARLRTSRRKGAT